MKNWKCLGRDKWGDGVHVSLRGEEEEHVMTKWVCQSHRQGCLMGTKWCREQQWKTRGERKGQLCDGLSERREGKTRREKQEEWGWGGGGRTINDGNRAEKSGLNDWVREVKEEERWHSSACSWMSHKERARGERHRGESEEEWNRHWKK